MANKPSNVRDRIPSVSDLLENPSIRILAERLNRNAVVSGLRSFLEDIRSDLNRRGAEAVWPTLRDLAERAVRHISATQQSSERPAINATGRLWGAPWSGRPQCNAALERAYAASRDFVAAPSGSGSLAAGDAEALICRLTGAEAAVAVHSYAGGLWLALAAVAAGREVIVSRGQLGEIEPGCPISKLIASSGAILKEVGSTNRTSAADYESAFTRESAVLLSVCHDTFRLSGDTGTARFDELAVVARDRELALIDAIGNGPIVDLPSDINWPDRSAQASLAAGAKLVVLRGDGLVGGPGCGILAGKREIIQQITQLPMFAAYRLDVPRAAALAATLQCHAERSDGESGVPLIELLKTPLENLRNRAERLAPQLALAGGIRTADVVSLVSHCDGLPNSDRSLRCFGVALTPESHDVSSLDRRLTSATEPVFGRIEGGRLILDLRTVLPRQDQAIVRALSGESQSTPAPATATSSAT